MPRWVRQMASWTPFLACAVAPGDPPGRAEEPARRGSRANGNGDSDRGRQVVVRLAEVSIIVGVLWLRLDKIEARVETLTEKHANVAQALAVERSRNADLRLRLERALDRRGASP